MSTLPSLGEDRVDSHYYPKNKKFNDIAESNGYLHRRIYLGACSTVNILVANVTVNGIWTQTVHRCTFTLNSYFTVVGTGHTYVPCMVGFSLEHERTCSDFAEGAITKTMITNYSEQCMSFISDIKFSNFSMISLVSLMYLAFSDFIHLSMKSSTSLW